MPDEQPLQYRVCAAAAAAQLRRALSPARPLSQFSKIVPVKTAYLRYAACGCCLYDKNANYYNFYFTNAARTVTITIKAMPKGRSFSSTVRNRSDSAGAAQNFLVRRFFA